MATPPDDTIPTPSPPSTSELERWQRLKAIFVDVVEHERTAREAVLRELAARDPEAAARGTDPPAPLRRGADELSRRRAPRRRRRGRGGARPQRAHGGRLPPEGGARPRRHGDGLRRHPRGGRQTRRGQAAALARRPGGDRRPGARRAPHPRRPRARQHRAPHRRRLHRGGPPLLRARVRRRAADRRLLRGAQARRPGPAAALPQRLRRRRLRAPAAGHPLRHQAGEHPRHRRGSAEAPRLRHRPPAAAHERRLDGKRRRRRRAVRAAHRADARIREPRAGSAASR